MTNAYPRARTTYAVVGTLMLYTFFSLIDRMIPSFLVDPMRRSLQASDTQISLVQGAAFAIIFAIAGLPFGWFADRANRPRIISVAAFVWSAGTILCGFADNFWQLFWARFLVGVGEAALAPAAYSLMADYVEPRRRGTVMTTYFLSSSIGSGVAFIVIGYLITIGPDLFGSVPVLRSKEPWQQAFVLAGLPGLLLLPLLLLARDVPRRNALGEIASAQNDDSTMGAFLSYLGVHRATFTCLYLGIGLLMFCNIAGYSWVPTLLLREHGLLIEHIRTPLGLVVGIGGFIGTAFSIWYMSASAKSAGRMSSQRLVLIAATVTLPAELAWPLLPDWRMALVAFGVRCVGISVVYAAAPAIIQEVVPNTMRGKAVSLHMIITGLLGYAAAPTAVALFTDYVFGSDSALKYSLMACLIPAAALSLLAAVRGRIPFERTKRQLQ